MNNKIDIKGTGTPYSLDKIVQHLDNYNFIISTATQTIDTSRYCRYMKNDTLQATELYSGNEKCLVLSTKKTNKATGLANGEDIVVVFEKSIKSVVVKSIRGPKGFLLNQCEINKN